MSNRHRLNNAETDFPCEKVMVDTGVNGIHKEKAGAYSSSSNVSFYHHSSKEIMCQCHFLTKGG